MALNPAEPTFIALDITVCGYLPSLECSLFFYFCMNLRYSMRQNVENLAHCAESMIFSMRVASTKENSLNESASKIHTCDVTLTS